MLKNTEDINTKSSRNIAKTNGGLGAAVLVVCLMMALSFTLGWFIHGQFNKNTAAVNPSSTDTILGKTAQATLAQTQKEASPQNLQSNNASSSIQSLGFPQDSVDALNELYDLLSSEALLEIDSEKLKSELIDAVINSLNDPYADWLTPEESTTLMENINSQYSGMGFDTVIHKGEFVIANVLVNSAAYRAGLQSGEALIALNGIPLKGKDDLFKAAKELNSKTPTLTLKSKSSRTVTLKVAPYVEPTVTYNLVDNTYAYIDINTFSSETSEALKKALTTAKTDNAKGIIFDVRFNYGGFMDACYESLSMLIDDKIIAYETSKEDVTPVERKGEQIISLPYAVLINSQTFSAAELFAQSLKQHEKAYLVGQTTFGKGTQQSLFTSEDGTIKFSTAHFSATPDSIFSEEGVKPDFSVELPFSLPQNDHFLEAARRFLSRGLSP